MQQKRLILALLISTAILFLWSYLVPVKPPQQPAASPSPQATAQPTGTATNSPVVASTPVSAASPTESANAAPHRIVLIKTPLYEAKLDSRGAEAISWIIKKNKDSQQEIYSVGGDRKTHIPLELVSQEGLKRQPREAPLQLATGEGAVDSLLTSTNYSIEGIDDGTGDAELTLGAGETKRITFLLKDAATGLDVAKT
jgi:YidC/Oxa1 family membrane protein insertase